MEERRTQHKVWLKRVMVKYWQDLTIWEMKRIVWEAALIYSIASLGANGYWSHLADPGRIIALGQISATWTNTCR